MNALRPPPHIAALVTAALSLVSTSIAQTDADDPKPTDRELRLARIFGDGMVLQRGSLVSLRGFATPGMQLEATAGWPSAEPVQARADDSGRFILRMQAPTGAGGPYEIVVREDTESGQSMRLRDVWLGDVWLCSGQSNMEMPVGSVAPPTYSGVVDAEREIATADRYPRIRLFRVANTASPVPLDDVSGGWSPAAPDSVRQFSATAWFFGRTLYEELGVPIGLIASDWGGTPAEAWTSAVGLAPFEQYAGTLRVLAEERAEPGAIAKRESARIATWVAQLTAGDRGQERGFHNVDYDSSDWDEVGPGVLREAPYRSFDGVLWLRCEFELPASAAATDIELDLGAIDDMDRTFLNGTLVGTTERPRSWDTERHYRVEAGIARPGRNVVAIRVIDTGGNGGLVSQTPVVRVDGKAVPLDRWRVRKTQRLNASPRPPRLAVTAFTPTALYNGMIAPLAPLGLKGVIWYQGESNRARAAEYRSLLPQLIRDWRRTFVSELPFGIVQIAPFRYPRDVGETAELREAQRLTANQVAGAGMVVTLDVGDPVDIHPRRKQEVGFRLAHWALSTVYGIDKPWSGPVPTGLSRTGDGKEQRLVLEFEAAVASSGAGSSVRGVEVRLPDGSWTTVSSVVDGARVVVELPAAVTGPTSVRYAWAAVPNADLIDAASRLPASGFLLAEDGAPSVEWVTSGRAGR